MPALRSGNPPLRGGEWGKVMAWTKQILAKKEPETQCKHGGRILPAVATGDAAAASVSAAAAAGWLADGAGAGCTGAGTGGTG